MNTLEKQIVIYWQGYLPYIDHLWMKAIEVVMDLEVNGSTSVYHTLHRCISIQIMAMK